MEFDENNIRFDENDIRFSEFGFLLEGQLFTENYIDKVYKAGLNLISIENNNLAGEDHNYANYVDSMNSLLKQNLIKSTFIFLFSNYENDLFQFIRKYKYSNDGELLRPNRNTLKANLESIKKIFKLQHLDYALELTILEKIRNLLIHRNGKLLNDELSLKKEELMFNNENIFSIDEICLNINVNENIIFYTHEIVGKFYEYLINKALYILNNESGIIKRQK
jgi:hypothetical protein